jgi:hypothetical protein
MGQAERFLILTSSRRAQSLFLTCLANNTREAARCHLILDLFSKSVWYSAFLWWDAEVVHVSAFSLCRSTFADRKVCMIIASRDRPSDEISSLRIKHMSLLEFLTNSMY